MIKSKKKKKSRSTMMVNLYGSEYAQDVYERLESLDPELNDLIQRVPYDLIWSRPGLNFRDKALVTVAALVALGKEEQTKIHMRGFLNSGGTLEELRNALIHLSIYCGFPAALNGFAALKAVQSQSEQQGRE